jgi:Fur family iron response transcriptional regulator
MRDGQNEVRERLRAAGLRATRQRIELAHLIFRAGHRHLTAEQLHNEARAARVSVSLATIYNTLHQFTAAGLLREIAAAPQRSYFDTNTRHHHHFFNEENGDLVDIPAEDIAVAEVPAPPSGTVVRGVDVVVRVGRGTEHG